jgi:hypothetical protein
METGKKILLYFSYYNTYIFYIGFLNVINDLTNNNTLQEITAMKNSRVLTILIITVSIFDFCYGQPGKNIKNPNAEPTYENAGIYWKTPESGECRIRYRKDNSPVWKEGLDLVYDARDNEYRGSIIKLDPDTGYIVELSTNSATTELTFRTRRDNFPVGRTTFLPEGESDRTIVITESGTPDAYHLVTVPHNSKSVLNLKNVYDYGIDIDADYVIVRGAEIRNPRIHGIFIRRNRHDIIIEQCYITFWGRIGGPITYGNVEGGMDSGIWAENGTWNLTIQRNLIEDPRGASNDWTTGHPAGPQGISVIQSLGGNVIRYNDIVSTEDHGYNDAIGGSSNYSDVGNMNRDSDIYGNYIRNVWDDAIEVEGANMNVRIYGNYMDKFFMGIATAATTRGPLYIFRNVAGESRIGHRNTQGGSFIKTGEREPFAGGRKFIFHNTTLQPNGVFHIFTSHVNPNCITRNNIFDAPGRLATDREKEPASDYDYDYFSGVTRGTAQQPNGIRLSTTPSGTRLYVSSYKLEFYPRLWVNSIIWGSHPYEFGERKRNITDPVVQIRNPMINGGILIPGFNDDHKGSAPDIGAFEVGAPPLEFGRRAYLNYDQGWAPWERH